MVLNNIVKAFWYMSNNFGDNLNYYLINKISGDKNPVYTENRKEKHFIVCGSILTEANNFSTVWGAGCANHSDIINSSAKIISVRGELSKNKCEQKPEIIGDPALLMPLFYDPQIEKKHKTGIIPHWKDMEKASLMNKEYLIINPLKPALDVINDILSCERIISSSLHGLILSDAYMVPNRWVDFGTEIGGDGFKFEDYYSSTSMEKKANEGDFFVSKYKHNLQDLLKSCPFYEQK